MNLAIAWVGRSLDTLEPNRSVAVPDLDGQVEAIVAGLERAGVVHLDHHASGKNLAVSEDGTLSLIDYGNAVLTRFKVKRHQNHKLPSMYQGEQRGVLEVEAETPGGPLLFLATHLDYRREDKERRASVQTIEELFKSRPDAPAAPLGSSFGPPPLPHSRPSPSSSAPRQSLPPTVNDHPGFGAARSRPIRPRIAANIA